MAIIIDAENMRLEVDQLQNLQYYSACLTAVYPNATDASVPNFIGRAREFSAKSGVYR